MSWALEVVPMNAALNCQRRYGMRDVLCGCKLWQAFLRPTNPALANQQGHNKFSKDK
jgi:hypothetical protein